MTSSPRRMTPILILLYLLVTKAAIGAVQRSHNKWQDCKENDISVISFVSPDTEIGSRAKSLEEIHNLAVLTNDHRAVLPNSFTICSYIMSVFSTKKNYLMFFNLLGSDGKQLLPAIMFGNIFYTTRVASGQILNVFPNQWVRSCMAIDTISGVIQWVVDGNPVENNSISALKDFKTNLNGMIILGAWQSPTKSWFVFSNKLTNLNIFYGLLPQSAMMTRTNGDHICQKHCLYFLNT